ncbi:MAG TPA: DUF1045 domain-containing protein [Rhodospirillales bacterium]|nr:DUF1045 domain-containing protein [Rhodospirillales bacterium]
MEKQVRYAIYLAPDAESPVGRFGNTWLGFDPATGEDLPRPKISGITASQITEVAAAPSRYGFHGTLKPPFSLSKGRAIDELENAVRSLAARFRAFEIAKIQINRIGDFLALMPRKPDLLVEQLASVCVRELDQFRAPLDDVALAHRRQAGLSDRQDRLLRRWGYPYVLDEFQFHLTLTGKLKNDESKNFQKTLQKEVSCFVDVPLPVRDIALFRDPGDGGRFRLLKRYPLGCAPITSRKRATLASSGPLLSIR